jgi:hypothetical protein
MPYKDRKKQLSYLRAWRVRNAEREKKAKHRYFLAHQPEFAARRAKWIPGDRVSEGAEERRLLLRARDYTRWRDVPGEGRNPTRSGRRRKYLGTANERHAQAQRIYLAKRKAKEKGTYLETVAGG